MRFLLSGQGFDGSGGTSCIWFWRQAGEAGCPFWGQAGEAGCPVLGAGGEDGTLTLLPSQESGRKDSVTARCTQHFSVPRDSTD